MTVPFSMVVVVGGVGAGRHALEVGRGEGRRQHGELIVRHDAAVLRARLSATMSLAC